jgi:hypothetical protein
MDYDYNKILLTLDPIIKDITKFYRANYRDDIQQEIRIRLWNLMLAIPANEPKTYEDLIEFCKGYVYSVAMFSSKIVCQPDRKHQNRYIDIEQYDNDSRLSVEDSHEMLDYELRSNKYKHILTEQEYAIFKYLESSDETFKNLDAISKQFGYSGRGTITHHLKRIATKILEFNQKETKI